MDKIKAIFTEQVRAYIYRVLAAAGLVVGMYGYLTTDEIATWLGFAAVVLNVLPIANTSTK